MSGRGMDIGKDGIRKVLTEGGYTFKGLCRYGERWEMDGDHKALMSGWRLMVCSFNVWRSFSFGDASFLGMRTMERIVKMRPSAEGLEDTTQYALWISCDAYKASSFRKENNL